MEIGVKMSFCVGVYYWICFSASHIFAVSVSLSVFVLLCLSCCLCHLSLSLSLVFSLTHSWFLCVWVCVWVCVCPSLPQSISLATLLWWTRSLVDCSVQHLEVHETIAECMIFANHWVAKKIVDAFPSKALVSKGCFASFPFWDFCWIFMHCWINIKIIFKKYKIKIDCLKKVNTLSHFVGVCVWYCWSLHWTR